MIENIFDDIIENLFTTKYTHEEKMDILAQLERENAPYLDELIKKFQPLFYSKVYVANVPQGYKFPGYEKHTMSWCLITSMEKFKKDSNYNPKLDFSINRDLFNL